MKRRPGRPGGRLGKRLLKVRDVMHTGDDVPWVATSALIRDSICEMSRGKLGITAVTDARGRLVGCLSDGDLRRLLERDAEPLDRTAGDCMTPGPRAIDGGALASSALKLMEEHRVTALFVCDAEGRLEGVVHLHDLWRLELF